MSEIIAVIPVYNHASKIGAVIDGCLKHFPASDILVVDDGSTDFSAAEAGKRLVHIRRHGNNMGKGRALITGFNWACEHGAEWVLTLDADGQHAPGEIPLFIRSAKQGNYDLISGARKISLSQMPLPRYFSNRMSSAILARLTKVPILDSQCGYRITKTGLYKKIHFRANDYMLETEILIQAARMQARIGFIPISTIYGDEKSHIRSFKIVKRFFQTLWQYQKLGAYSRSKNQQR